jgi:hypothetical protein
MTTPTSELRNRDLPPAPSRVESGPVFQSAASQPVDEQTLDHLLGLCQREESAFTLKEIVSRILNENPEMLRAFAHAWEELIRRKCIRVLRHGRPSVYGLWNR